MNIVFVIATNKSGGAERVIVTLANYFAETGHNSYLINFDENSSFYPVNPDVTVIKLSQKYPALKKKHNAVARELTIIRLLSGEFASIRPDVVIPFLFNAEFPVITVCRAKRIPCITSVRNSANAYPYYQRLYRKINYPFLAGIVFQSSQVMNHSDFKRIRNKRVIMNPLSGSIIRDRGATDKTKIISVGRLNKQKNHLLTIGAFKKIHNDHPELRLEIFGEGEEREELNRFIAENGLGDCVFLRGAVENAVQRNADARLYVMASDYEGFPNSLLEAMACRIPVVCSDFDSGIARYLIGDDERGYLFPVGDLEALEEKMLKAVTDFEGTESKAGKAIEKCSEFEYHSIGREWERFIELSI